MIKIDNKVAKETLIKAVELEAWCRKHRVDHPDVEVNWEKMYKELKKNMNECIEFLKNCSEKELEAVSPIFDDLSGYFQSLEFVNELKELQMKYPKADLTTDIKCAERALKA